jgi:hypothetical protein
MQWYYSKNGTQLGPIGTEDIQSKLASGEISQSDLAWKDGMADWLPAGQIPELRPVLQATSPVAPVSSSPVASPYSPPVAPPVAPVSHIGVPLSPTCGKATTAMVLGICGLVFSFCCGPIGLVCGILAIVFGNQAKQQIAQNPIWAADLGKAKSGVIMGWIAIALSIIVTAASIIFQVSAASLQNLNH